MQATPPRVFDETARPSRDKLKLRRPVSVRVPGAKAWSHQQDLNDLKGKQVVLIDLNGIKSEGMLIDADQFTIKMALPQDERVPVARIVTIFKHALGGFEPV